MNTEVASPTTTSTRQPERRRPSTVLIVMICVTVMALVFAGVGLGMGLTKGSPTADKQRVVTLQDDLSTARLRQVTAVRLVHDAGTKAEKFDTAFDKMLSIAEAQQKNAAEVQLAGILGDVELENQLIAEFNALLDQHNTATDQLSSLPEP